MKSKRSLNIFMFIFLSLIFGACAHRRHKKEDREDAGVHKRWDIERGEEPLEKKPIPTQEIQRMESLYR